MAVDPGPVGFYQDARASFYTNASRRMRANMITIHKARDTDGLEVLLHTRTGTSALRNIAVL
jgi:hypothetical protein